MLGRLAANPNITLQKSDLRYRVNSAHEKDAVTKSDIRIFYSEIEAFQFRWIIRPEAEAALGENAEGDVIGGAANFIPWIMDTSTITKYGSLKGELQEISSQLDPHSPPIIHPIEYLPGDKMIFLFQKKNGDLSNNLQLFDFNATPNIRLLNANIDEYIKQGINCWFFYNWQQAVFLGDIPKKKKILDYIHKLT